MSGNNTTFSDTYMREPLHILCSWFSHAHHFCSGQVRSAWLENSRHGGDATDENQQIVDFDVGVDEYNNAQRKELKQRYKIVAIYVIMSDRLL